MSSNNRRIIDDFRGLLRRIVVDSDRPDVEVDLAWRWNFPGSAVGPSITAGLHQVALDLFGSANTVALPNVPGFPGFSIRYTCQKRIHVRTELNFRIPWDFLRCALRRYNPTYYPSRLLYHALYFPAAWYLGSRFSRFWIHAAGLVRNGRAVVIGGLPGIGKTTLCTRLMLEGEFSLLSDDLLFYSDGEVATCYEPVRMSEPPEAFDDLEQVGRLSDKPAFDTSDLQIDSAEPAGVILPRFGSEAKAEQIPSRSAAHRLYATSRTAAQVGEFDFYGRMLAAYFEMDDWFPGQIAQLETLAENVPCFAVTLDRRAGPEPAQEMISEIVDDVI
ncbi:MAG: hypothetical protein ACLFWB_11525 [Armatimonadota bacterium]